MFRWLWPPQPELAVQSGSKLFLWRQKTITQSRVKISPKPMPFGSKLTRKRGPVMTQRLDHEWARPAGA